MAENASERIICLHGDLFLYIIEARNLPNIEAVTSRIRSFVTFEACRKSTGSGSVTSDPKLRSGRRRIITSDSYVQVSVSQTTVARTRVLKNSNNPRWIENFIIPLAHPLSDLDFLVKNDDVYGSDLLGIVTIPAEKLAIGDVISGWFPVENYNKKTDSELKLEMKFVSCDKNPFYRHGIAGDPAHKGVRNTYFPVRKGCNVTLYQDAHVRDGEMPEIELDSGKVFKHRSCWEDICHAISEAHHMIYIVGWSISHKIKLIREPTRPLPRGGDMTLGELLKYKSEEGVRVLVVGNAKTSPNNTTGVMGTHDEETIKYFKHSSVMYVLLPRYGSNKRRFFKKVVETVFTYHQRYVLVDTHASGNNRKVTSFVGGLDLFDGRYDTPEHRFFRDLDTVFKDDVPQSTYLAETKAPRQPWHDLNCKIDGPAAYDVLMNFEQCWKKATELREFALLPKKKAQWQDNALIKIERISWIVSPIYPAAKDGDHSIVPEDDPLLHVSREDSPDNWHVQIFRSIDSGSLKGFPKTVDVWKEQNLICAKSLVIDKSIQTAYIQAIRSAQHFIYIENQYFIGSSYAWPDYKDAGADNLVPMELALKIATKIRAGERFAVYIVIPMWPEGVPASATVQRILYWQSRTMQTMYYIIAHEIKAMQLDAHPEDYLNFYCLGKREELPTEMSQEPDENVFLTLKTHLLTIELSKSLRFTEVQTLYDICACKRNDSNINQRSLAGSRDTEIAMGSYQPHHTWAAKKRHPHGQIYGYRMSLWAEHLGILEECYKEGESLECVRKVNEVAKSNWINYTNDEFSELQGHILKYPLQVDAEGKVSSLPGYENFPDLGGKVIGSLTNFLAF